MTKKVINGDSLKWQRKISSSNNENEYEGLKKRKSEKLQELFGDATLPDSKIDITDRKKSSITESPQITQNTEKDISSNSGIAFADALNMVASGSNKKRKIDKHDKLINEKKQTKFNDGNEKQHTKSYKTDKQKIRADDNHNSVCFPKNDNKSITTKTTTVDLEKHKTKNENKSALDKNQSKHTKKYQDKKETKIIEQSINKNNKNKSDKEENIIITKKHHKHNKNDEKNNENKKHTTKIVDKQKNKCDDKKKSSSENKLKRNLVITTAKEISSSSGIGFAEALEITTIDKSKSKQKKKN